jgi:acetyl-CoA C-acetyltransferase
MIRVLLLLNEVPGDGAAAIVLAEESTIVQHQLKPLARIVAWASVGTDPAETGLGAVPAVKKLLATTKLTSSEVDLFEVS